MIEFKPIYKDNYFANEYKFKVIIAETTHDANMFFFDNYSGTIFRTEFIDWV